MKMAKLDVRRMDQETREVLAEWKEVDEDIISMAMEKKEEWSKVYREVTLFYPRGGITPRDFSSS